MPIADVATLRNVILLSHSGAGKTSLGEALLFQTKAITRMGRVDDGNTVSDYEAEEAKRTSSVQTSLLPCNWEGSKINVLDTPGYDDFAGEVVSALRVADAAVILVAAPSGAELGTEKGWARCEDGSLPRIFYVNKMDRENADFGRTLQQIQELFGRKCIPFQIPIGSEQSFKGVIDVLNLPDDIPAEVAGEVAAAREQLLEAVAETDDELINKFLEGEEISDDELMGAARRAVISGEVVPVLAGSAVASLGISELLDAIVRFLPSPAYSKTRSW